MSLHLIAGVPRSGKTTSAGRGAWSTDALGTDRASWDVRVDEVANRIRGQRDGTIEGVLVPHALRRVLRDEPTPNLKHVRVTFLHTPREALSAGQARMAKATRTIFREIRAPLEAAGAEVSDLG